MSTFKLVVQGLRFGLVGGMSTLVHISVFVFCIELLHIRPFIANFPAFGIAVMVGFIGHFSWTFRHHNRDERREWMPALIKFAVVSLIGLGINSMIVYGIVDMAHLQYAYAIVLMLTVTPALVFILSKLWAFA